MVQWSAPKLLPVRTDVQWLERTRLSMRPSHTDRLPRSSHIVCTYSLMLLLLSIFLLHSLSEEIVVHVVCFVDPGVSCIRTWNCVPTHNAAKDFKPVFFPYGERSRAADSWPVSALLGRDCHLPHIPPPPPPPPPDLTPPTISNYRQMMINLSRDRSSVDSASNSALLLFQEQGALRIGSLCVNSSYLTPVTTVILICYIHSRSGSIQKVGGGGGERL